MTIAAEKELVVGVLDALGETDLHDEVANLRTAMDDLDDATTLAEIRINLQDMEDAAVELVRQIAQARQIFRAKVKAGK